MTEIVAVDIGGTHVRFAVAQVEAGRVVCLGQEHTLLTGDHAGLASAWKAFAAGFGRPLPAAAAIAVAGAVRGREASLTNAHWSIRPDSIRSELGAERHILINDFGAVAHAVAQLGDRDFRPLCGPERPLPKQGAISIVGPGTGLGVAQLLRHGDRYRVVETEGGHIAFAPLDPLEDRILARLRARYGRVSVERIVSGAGLANLYEALVAIKGAEAGLHDETSIWTAAMTGEDGVAAAALDLFCRSLGAVTGDIALAHGAQAAVIGGGLGLRLIEHLPRSGFAARFVAKGRFRERMEDMPVKIITHRQPGLFGAAAAFAAEHRE